MGVVSGGSLGFGASVHVSSGVTPEPYDDPAYFGEPGEKIDLAKYKPDELVRHGTTDIPKSHVQRYMEAAKDRGNWGLTNWSVMDGFLRKYPGCVDVRDPVTGNTALMEVQTQKNAYFLRRDGADINARNNNNETAVDLLKDKKDEHLKEFLDQWIRNPDADYRNGFDKFCEKAAKNFVVQAVATRLYEQKDIRTKQEYKNGELYEMCSVGKVMMVGGITLATVLSVAPVIPAAAVAGALYLISSAIQGVIRTKAEAKPGNGVAQAIKNSIKEIPAVSLG